MTVGPGYLLLGALFCIFFTQVSDARKCFNWEKECPDGSCVGKRTGACAGECSWLEKRCPNGKCVPSLQACPGECRIGQKKCPDGECRKRCPGECRIGQKKCQDGECRRRCPQDCSSFEKRCPDGSCVSRHTGRCSGDCYSWEKKCPDGSCRELCPGDCRASQKKCPDGSCVLRTRSCPEKCLYNEKKCYDGKCVDSATERCWGQSCPSHRPLSCAGSNKCYPRSLQCDNIKFCSDGSDERNCSHASGWWYYLMIPIFAIFLKLFCLYKCCKYQNAAGRLPSSTSRGSHSATHMETLTEPSHQTRASSPIGLNLSHNDRRYRQIAAFRNEREELLSGTVTPLHQERSPVLPRGIPSAPPEPPPGAPPAYDTVVSSDKFNVPPGEQDLPSYEEVLHLSPDGSKR